MLRYTTFRRETRYTLRGLPFTVNKEEPVVPRIDDRFLDCAVYLYHNLAEAKKRERAGGCGFLVSVSAAVEGWLASGKCPVDNWCHYYAVSNRHVVQASPVICLNTHDGSFDAIPLLQDDWTCSDKHDLAVAPIDPTRYKFAAVDMKYAVTKEVMAKHDIGLGDDVFLVGRFISHDGTQRNSPTLRCGNIAMMPFEPVHHPSNPTGLQEGFLVEFRMIPGYSGSPVFVRPCPELKVGLACSPDGTQQRSPYDSLGYGPWLLGVEWGVVHSHNQDTNSGMSGVVPAWHLWDLLNTEKLREERRREQEEFLLKQEQRGVTLT